MALLAIVRHGESTYNQEGKFTGWVDVDLTENGKEEAKKAGEKLKPYHFDEAYTSELVRAQHTLDIILEITGAKLPITRDKALNERMYGDLQGLNKAAMAQKVGEEQVHQWRRSYDVQPPGGESLKDTVERVIPYYQQHIEPKLLEGKDILISAHGNSLRALMMYLEHISEQDIPEVEIPTGTPKIYQVNEQGKVTSSQYL